MEGKNATAIKTKPYEQNIITQTCGPFHGPKQHVHFKAYATTPQSVPFLHACVAFISCFKDDTVTLVICYALKCDCCLGLSLCAFKFVYGLHVTGMVLGELRFFLPWTAFHKQDLHETRGHIPASTRHSLLRMRPGECRLARRPARRQPPRSPRFARLARRPALDM